MCPSQPPACRPLLLHLQISPSPLRCSPYFVLAGTWACGTTLQELRATVTPLSDSRQKTSYTFPEKPTSSGQLSISIMNPARQTHTHRQKNGFPLPLPSFSPFNGTHTERERAINWIGWERGEEGGRGFLPSGLHTRAEPARLGQEEKVLAKYVHTCVCCLLRVWRRSILDSTRLEQAGGTTNATTAT